MADGKLIRLTKRGYSLLDQATLNFCFRSNRGLFLDSLGVHAFPQLESPFLMQDLVQFAALSRKPDGFLKESEPISTIWKNSDVQLEIPEFLDDEKLFTTSIAVSDTTWNEMIRVAKLGGYSTRQAFLRDFIYQVLPLFTGFCSMKELAVVLRTVEKRREIAVAAIQQHSNLLSVGPVPVGPDSFSSPENHNSLSTILGTSHLASAIR